MKVENLEKQESNNVKNIYKQRNNFNKILSHDAEQNLSNVDGPTIQFKNYNTLDVVSMKSKLNINIFKISNKNVN